MNILITYILFFLSFNLVGYYANAEDELSLNDINDPSFIADDSAQELSNSFEDKIRRIKPENIESAKPEIVYGESLAQSDITVKRFDLNESEEALSQKLQDQTNEKNISVSKLVFKRIGGTKSFRAEQIKNINLNVRFETKSIDIDEENKTFTAVLKPYKGNFEIEVKGVYSASMKVPVITRNIGKGDQISQDDVELRNFPKEKIQPTDIVDISNILGKTATRFLSHGNMVAQDDIKNPILIFKNNTVSAISRTDTIEVKTLAVALDDGGIGDIIRFKNFDSGKIFRAVVQADGTALVGTTSSDAKDMSSQIVGPQPENNI